MRLLVRWGVDTSSSHPLAAFGYTHLLLNWTKTFSMIHQTLTQHWTT